MIFGLRELLTILRYFEPDFEAWEFPCYILWWLLLVQLRLQGEHAALLNVPVVIVRVVRVREMGFHLSKHWPCSRGIVVLVRNIEPISQVFAA
jgi:hypothetical protein